jgi:hypothetical protein
LEFGLGRFSLYNYIRPCVTLRICGTPPEQTTDGFLSGKFLSLRHSEYRRSSSLWGGAPAVYFYKAGAKVLLLRDVKG